MKKWTYKLEALLLTAVLVFSLLGAAVPAEVDGPTETLGEIAAGVPEPTESAEKEASAEEPEGETDVSKELSEETAPAVSEGTTPEETAAQPQTEESDAPGEEASSEDLSEDPLVPEEEPGEAEEPAADDPKDSDSGDMTIDATNISDVDISEWSGTLAYYEKNAPFVPVDTTNVLMLTINNFGNNYASFQAFFNANKNDFTFELKKEGEDAPVAGFPATYTDTATVAKLYWALGDGSRIQASGKYTLTMKKTSGSGTPLTVDCEIVEVIFNAGEGTFVGGGKEYKGYGMKGAAINKFNVPDIETTPRGDFIGWSKEQDASTYGQLVNNIDDSSDRLYAAYGTAKTFGMEFQQNGVKTEKLTFETKNYTAGEYDCTQTVKIKNTGNTELKNLRPTQTPANFTVSPGSVASIEGGGESEDITIKPKAGLPVGKYNETITFLAESGHKTSLTAVFEVTRPTVTVNISDNVTKTYGEVKSSSDVAYTLDPQDADVKGWTPIFQSSGFASGVDVGNYDIILLTTTKPENYDVKLGTQTHQVIVGKATPEEVNVTATSVLEGKNLEDSKLSGTFQNPYDSSMKVNGKLEWESGQESSTNLTVGEHSFKWKFTPTGEAEEKNYNIAQGTVTVKVTAKNPTNISLTSGTTFTYNGEQHGLTFTTNRPANEHGAITVQYSLAGGNTYSPDMPKDAGSYDVKASIPASATYAASEQSFTMKIEKRQLDIVVTGGDKVYDGTANVKGGLTFYYTNRIGSDDVKLEEGGYTAAFRSEKAGKNQTVIVKDLSLSGQDAGNYKPPTAVHGIANINPAKITNVAPKETITKGYGAARALTVEDFNFTGLVNNESASVLNAEFICAGQDAKANAGEYDITVNLHGGNYVLENPNAGKMKVTKVMPELLPDTLYVGKGVLDKPLRIVSISASFVNPNDSMMSVAGEVAWKEGTKKIEGTAGDTIEEEWTFTPFDTANYETPTVLEKAKIILVDAVPVPFTVAEKEFTYNGNKQGPTDADVTTQPMEDGPLGEVEIKIEYRKYVQLAKVAAISEESTTDWSSNMPTNAGQYQAKIIVSPAEENIYTENESIIFFSIEKATPDISGVQKELKVKEGLSLHEANVELNKPNGVDGKALEGTFAWQNGDTPVSDDGEVYQWQFTPEETDNYHSVSGTVTVNLAPDERKIIAEVYNLPSAHGYTDYAVIDVNNSGLLPGDTVIFFKDAACAEAIGETAVVAEGDSEIVVEFDGGTLETTKGSVYALITSSKKHTATAITYPNEIDLEVSETLTVYTGGTRELVAKAIGEDFKDATFNIEGDQSSELIDVTQAGGTADTITLKVTGKEIGSASMIIEMTFQHPDTVRHFDEAIVLRKTVIVSVLEGCDLTINGKVDESVPDPAAHSVQYTLALFESGTSAPANVDGTFTATKYIPKTNEIRREIMPLAQEPSDTVTEEITLTFANGTTTFTCKANESITIHGLPTGTKFQVRVKPLDGDVVSTDSDGILEGSLSSEGGSVTSTLKEKLVESITMIPAEIELNVGDSYTLEAKITPEDVSEANRALTWTSSDPSVVTVSEGSGLTNQVTALAVGTATVTARTVNGMSGECIVRVVPVSSPSDSPKPDGVDPLSSVGGIADYVLPAQTGDDSPILGLTVALAVSLALVLACAVKLRKGRKGRP